MKSSKKVAKLFKNYQKVMAIKINMENNPNNVNLLNWWDCENAERELKNTIQSCIENPFDVDEIYNEYDHESIQQLIFNTKQ